MSESKHTPGPWHACNTGKCSCKTVSCRDYPIARVTTGDWGDDYPSVRIVGESSLNRKAEAYMEQITYGSVNEETAIANAILIAAAPDLLEALQGVLRVADRKTDEFDAARAAIAKATTPVS